MKDKLDILLGLIKANNRISSNPYESILNSVAHDTDAFLFLYESMPPDCKPQLKTATTIFKYNFLNAIKKQDEKTFNNYLFSGLHELLTTDQIRDLYFEFPTNEKIKAYSKSKDNPKNIDEIVHVLSQLWNQKSDRYQETFDEYLPKLQKLSQIKSKKSRAADYFANWGRNIIERDGLEKFFVFCETINLDPYTFCARTQVNFHINPFSLNISELKFLINYGEREMSTWPTPRSNASYEVISKIGAYNPIFNVLKTLTQNESEENLEKFTLLWKTQQTYIKDLLTRIDPSIVKHNGNTVEVIKKYIKRNLTNENYDRELCIYKQDFDRIIVWSSYAELQLTVKTKSDTTQNKKIKL